MSESLGPQPSKRRRLLHKSPERHGRASSPAPVSPPTQPHPTLLDKTLEDLSDCDRQTLAPYISSDSCDSALRSALAAAKKQYFVCLGKRWKITFNGRTIFLREQADKVVKWLNRFKAVGDIAVNADPVHAGLPWAGIRLLLEVAVSDTNYMASLLVGCGTALKLANRLRIYVEFLQGLKACTSRDNLEATVIELFKCILEFLAQAIRTYEAPTIRRTLSAIWNEDKVATFERTCLNLAQHAENDASNCDRIKYQEDMRVVLDKLETIYSSSDRHDLETKLDKIPYAGGAIFDARDSIHELCHPQTRRDILQQIRDWISQPDAKAIFWLSGPAGTGKSTISWTIAKELCDDNSLAAAFFFKRGEGDRGSSSRFFSTIVKQLVINIPEIDRPIAEAIRLDPLIFDKALAEQFNKLILAPLLSVETQPAIVVVDALDECDNEIDIRTIVRLWSLLPPARLKLFLTSRPDTPIRLEFSTMPQCHQHIKLDMAPNIKYDLAVYIRYKFGQIYNDNQKLSGHDWIDQDTLDRLVRLSDPLFIIAATICRFVGDPNWDPKDRLSQILNHRSTSQLSNIQRTYLPILTQVMAICQNSDDQEILTKQFQAVIGTIVCLVEPLSAAGLATLLDMPEDNVRLRLDRLYSVLSIPEDQSPIRVLHLSFPEFLLSQESRGRPFGVDGPSMHASLTDCCLRLLSKLRQNPLNLPPGQLRADIEPDLIESWFSPALRYACRYWVHHLQESRAQIDSGSFLQQHFLHWLEALSLLDCLAEAISFVETLIQIYPSDDFLEDARRFVLANRYVIDLAPVQTYISAIIFAPQMSKVKATARIPEWLSRYPEAPLQWGPELQKLQGHKNRLLSLALSPERNLLASGSSDDTVRLWDIKTGREVQRFEHTDEVSMVAFSGIELVSAADDGIVCGWDTHTGQQTWDIDTEGDIDRAALSPDGLLIAMTRKDGTICLSHIPTGRESIRKRHKDVRCVAFSADGFSLASGSGDNTVCIWNVNTGQQTQILQHNAEIQTITFSADNSLLASGTKNSICIWDAVTGHQIQALHMSGYVLSLTFSSDACLLASGSLHGLIHMWNTMTGQKLRSLYGHGNAIRALVFLRDDLLVSGSDDDTIRFWDLKPMSQGQTTKHDRTHEHIAFSPDGSLLASSDNDFVDLWNIHTGQMIQSKPAKGTEISFSPDNSLLAWVAEEDTVNLWDLRTGDANNIFRGQESYIDDITFSPDSSSLAIATRKSLDDKENSTVHLWDIATGQELHRLLNTVQVTTTAFSPTGALLAVGSNHGKVIIWNIEKSQPTQTVYQFGVKYDHCSSLAISQNGDLLAVGRSYPGTIWLWDLQAGQQVQILEDVSVVYKMRFASDNQSLITGRGIVSIDTDTFSFRSIACPNAWIQSGDNKLVWLPRDYQGHATDYQDGILAIAQHGGGVGFWQLHHDQDFAV